jgi:D-threo-aldose 1-dehydrogenase
MPVSPAPTDPFATRRVGRTELRVSQLGLGTGPLGGWPTAVPAEQAVATIGAAWDAGIRLFDTAPFYGHGLSEEHLGTVLRRVAREDFVLSTKVGRLLEEGDPGDGLFKGVPNRIPVYDFSYDGALRSLEASRERLGVERIDIAYIHDPDEHHQEALAGAYRALAELRAAGALTAIGVGMNWSQPLARFAEDADFDCMLCAGRYTLLEQDALEDLLAVAVARNVSVVAGGVFNSGLLVDPRPGATYNYLPAEPELIERGQALEAVCAAFEVPLRAAAIQFPLAHPRVAAVIVGARTPAQIEDTLAMIRFPIVTELWHELKRRGLVREDAPTPAG